MPPPDNSLTFESPSPGSSNSPRNQKANKRSVSPALDLIDQPMPKRQRRDIDWKVFDKKRDKVAYNCNKNLNVYKINLHKK